jgi:phage terminase large subunit-like protein
MSDGHELLQRLRALPPEQRRAALEAAGEAHARALDERWPLWAHGGQLPPDDEWTIWVLLCGRGFGKTRAGAEWISECARQAPDAKIALVAANPGEARKVMIEGRAGLFVAARDEERRAMKWEPSLRRLTFASGAEAIVYSGADGDCLRGGEHHFAWCDELPKWRRAQDTWDNLMMGLRAGERPRAVVTTTPRPVPVLWDVLDTPDVVLTGGATRDNPHLPPAFLRTMERKYGGTRLGRQELLGELIEDVQGALWPQALIEKSRVDLRLLCPGEGRGPASGQNGDSHFSERRQATEHGGGKSNCPPLGGKSNCPLPFRRVVIGVDPPATAGGDECGIVACGLGEDPGSGSRAVAYVLGDHSAGGLSPEQWARKVAGAAERWSADRIVAEGNQGGEMVEAVLRGAGLRLPVRRVHAKVGKARRAEPVAAFFESGDAKFAGRFPELERQLAGLVLGGDYQGRGSPDRADAMVWAMSDLLLRKPAVVPRVRAL